MCKYLQIVGFALLLWGCSDKDRWEVSPPTLDQEVEIYNVGEFYYSDMPITEFRQKFPFHLDANTPDSIYERQRKDTLEIKVQEYIDTALDSAQIQNGLTDLFRHVKYYFPKFEVPKVFVVNTIFKPEYKDEPVYYDAPNNRIFIAGEYFIGKGNEYLYGFEVEEYFQKNMNPENIVPSVSYALATHLTPIPMEERNLLHYLIYYGKLMTVQDAFLPSYTEELKIGYTPEEVDWCYANEFNMWNYFIHNDYLYATDPSLYTRFLAPAPFSKFYTIDETGNSVDLDSPGRAGVWLGWQIIKKYLEENPSVKLEELLVNENYDTIFKESHYKPQPK